MVKLSCRYVRYALLAVVCVLSAAWSTGACAQSSAEKALLTKAQSLAASGHLNMAVQTWQQVLLVDASNQEALLGIAKADMQLGKNDEARQYLDRLRAAGGNPADIARIQAMPSLQPQAVQLSQAAQLAQQGKAAEAMVIYRRVFGESPPAGDGALAYYDTEAAIPADRPHAIAGLRRLTNQFPADSRYSITLGRVLTYDAKTRAEGMEILRRYSNVPSAQAALNQAESWNAKPAAAVSAGERQERPTPKSVTSPESLAYRALNSGRLDEAKEQFQTILNKQPNNTGALSGMGYVYMKKQDFASAADYLERAKAAGGRGLDSTLNTARFWLKMGEAGDDLKAGDAASAAEGYRAALLLKPGNADALEGLGGALAQAGKNADAADAFSRALKADPQRLSAWRGFFLAQSAAGDAHDALDTNDRMPKAVRAQLATDPGYLEMLVQDNLAVGRKAEADRVIAQALVLPFPNEGRDMPMEKQLQYAGLLMAAKKYEPAIRLYQQVVAQHPENDGAWRALIAAQHQMKQDDAALASVGRMPQAVFDKQQTDAPFLALIGSIYQSQHELDRAQKYLERALSLDPSMQSGLSLQLADVYAGQGNPQKAYAIYRRVLDQNNQSLQAWRGILSALHQLNRDRDALRLVASMPDSVRLRIEEDPVYLQTLASIQDSAGQTQAALKTFSQLSRIYAEEGQDVPIGVQIQYGWMLLQAGDEQKLYALVSNLSGSPDMTDDQQADFNRLWASWSIQRANAALNAGDQHRALAILQTAAQAFPKNTDVYNALAGAYLKTGQPKQAVAIYSSFDMNHALLPQYQGAIGAALAARDMSHALEWLEVALDRFKSDPDILKLAAQYEQARGNNERAAAYYRAALDAMGPAPIGGSSASQLGAPPYGISPTQQLMQLLAPGGRAARMNELDSADADHRVDVSWQKAPVSHVPTLGDYTGEDQSPLDLTSSGSAQTLESTLADHAQSDQDTYAADVRRASHASRQPHGNYIDSAQTANQGQRDNVFRSDSVPVTLDRNSVAYPVEYLKPASARIMPTLPLAEWQSQDQNSHLESSFASDLNPASRLQAAVREMDGQSDLGQTLPQNNSGEPSVPISTPSDQIIGNPPVLARSEALALPPLRGAVVRAERPKTEREQIEEQLAVLQGASSGWLGGSSGVNYRSGQPGYDRLAAYSIQIEGSGTLGPNVRTTVITQPVLLDAGQALSTATFRQGTLPANAVPYEQSAAGIGGEFQLRASSFAARVGYTPNGFLVANVTGGLYVHPPSSHFTLTFGRDPITDTQLSYAGLRDLGSRSSTYPGNVWGGVITNAVEAQLAFGDNRAGWYIQGGGQYITGHHVEDNSRFDGDAGAYWAVWQRPEYGSLTLGMNFFGMHYDHNLRYFTYGQGGYFSPEAYMLAGIPVTFNGHYGPRFHYRLVGSLGVQALQESSTPYFPLDPAIQAANNDPYYPGQTSVGVNYSLNAEGAYAVAEHWYVGGYLNFNNARDYAAEDVGFFVRYLFRPQPANEEIGPTGIFPIQGLRPLQVP